jgi:hypothetical protein
MTLLPLAAPGSAQCRDHLCALRRCLIRAGILSRQESVRQHIPAVGISAVEVWRDHYDEMSSTSLSIPFSHRNEGTSSPDPSAAI